MLWQPIERKPDVVISMGRSYVEDFLAPKRKMSEQIPSWTTIARWRGHPGKGIRDFGLGITDAPFTRELLHDWWVHGIVSNQWRGVDGTKALELLPNKTIHDALREFIYPEVSGDWHAREEREEKAFALAIVRIDSLWTKFCEYFIIRRLIYDRVQRRKHFHVTSSDYY